MLKVGIYESRMPHQVPKSQFNESDTAFIGFFAITRTLGRPFDDDPSDQSR